MNTKKHTEYVLFFLHNGHNLSIKSYSIPVKNENFHVQAKCDNCGLDLYLHRGIVSSGSNEPITVFNALDMLVPEIDVWYPSCEEMGVYDVLDE